MKNLYKGTLTNYRVIHTFIVLLIILLDQIISYKIRQKGGFYICNSGISFSIKLSSQLWLIWSLLITIVLVFLYQKLLTNQNKWLAFAVILTLGGLLSNLIDRILWGCVVDYFQIFYLFPIFNLADIQISAGIWILLILFLFKPGLAVDNL